MLSFLKETQSLVKPKDFRVHIDIKSIFKNSIFDHWRKTADFSNKMWHIVLRSPTAWEPLFPENRNEWNTYLPPRGYCLCYLAEGNSTGHFIRVCSKTPSNFSVRIIELVNNSSFELKDLLFGELPNILSSGQSNEGNCRNSTHIWSSTHGTSPSIEAKGIRSF